MVTDYSCIIKSSYKKLCILKNSSLNSVATFNTFYRLDPVTLPLCLQTWIGLTSSDTTLVDVAIGNLWQLRVYSMFIYLLKCLWMCDGIWLCITHGIWKFTPNTSWQLRHWNLFLGFPWQPAAAQDYHVFVYFFPQYLYKAAYSNYSAYSYSYKMNN